MDSNNVLTIVQLEEFAHLLWNARLTADSSTFTIGNTKHTLSIYKMKYSEYIAKIKEIFKIVSIDSIIRVVICSVSAISSHYSYPKS